MTESLVFFRVKVLTQFQQQVKIIGNVPELGNWDPNHAILLHTDENLYPTWLNQRQIQVQSSTPIEFKLIIVDKHDITWEGTPNRKLELTSLKYFVWCTFNTVEIKIIPILSSSSDSLSLQQEELDNLDNARRYNINLKNGPFDSDFSSESNLGMSKSSMSDDDTDNQHNQLFCLEQVKVIGDSP